MKLHTTRRTFLGAAGIAGLSATVRPAAARVEPTPWGIKLGLASYTFRKFDRAKAIEMIKAVKTPWLSVKQDAHLPFKLSPDDIRQGMQEFKAAGLNVMSAGNTDMSKAKTKEDLKHFFEWARIAGIPMLVIAPTHENMGMVESLVKEYDIRVALHNHGPEDKNFPTPQSVLEVVRKMDPRCGLCMDIGHSARTGVDVVKSIADASSRLLDMHVKDLANFTSRDSQVDVGEGIMPFPAIFKQLKKMNYQGCVNLEYEIHDDDPLPGVLRSFSYMRGVLAGLAAA